MNENLLRIPPDSITARQYAGRDRDTICDVPIGDAVIVQGIADAYDPRLFEPVKVRDLGAGKYELVDGHHRLAAARLLKLDSIPAIVVEFTSDADRLAVQVGANNARAKDSPETLGQCFARLQDGGKSETEAARSVGVTVATARKYAALAESPDVIREWYRDGRLPLETVAMISEHPISAGAMRRLAEAYIREKAQHPKFQPADFRLFTDEFVCQLLAAPPAMTQTSLLNADEDPAEIAAIERATAKLDRQKRVDFEKVVKRVLADLADPEVAAAVAARSEHCPLCSTAKVAA